ncbi:MAG: tetratricopeptide repeat protein [Balneolaceae bacterium]
MNNFLTRTAGFLLAFGIFFTVSCSTFNNTQEGTDTHSDQNLHESLEDLNEQIQDSPQNVDLKIRKARLLFELAKNQSLPAPRLPYYQNLRNTADDIGRQSDGNHSELDNIIEQAWSLEQSNGVALLQQDSTSNFEQYFETIIDHFDNAITIQPDSIVTYNLQATTYYKHGNISKAVESLKVADEIENGSNRTIKERLAYLYLEAGNLDEAIRHYDLLVTEYPDLGHLKHGLVNAYILNDNHQQAVNLLSELSEQYPARYEYQEALATEKFHIFKNEIHQVTSGQSFDSNEANKFIEEIDSISAIFDSLSTQMPAYEETTYRIAAFYKEAAFELNRLAALIDNEESAALTSRVNDLYEQALPYWQELTETNPDNMGYMKNLFEIYVSLDMEEEAEAIQRSFNF